MKEVITLFAKIKASMSGESEMEHARKRMSRWFSLFSISQVTLEVTCVGCWQSHFQTQKITTRMDVDDCVNTCKSK
jgi:hypothetical protein